jgi:hypothetical protein
MAWDSPLSALEEIVTACAELEDAGVDELRLDRLIVEMPIELQTRTGADGSVVLAVAPPRQAASTTVMPVLHRLRLVVEEQR